MTELYHGLHHDFSTSLQEGLVVKIDEKKHKVKVVFPHLDHLESHWLQVITPCTHKNQFYGLPDMNELVMCLMDARGENGLVIGAIFNDKDKPPILDKNKRYWRFEDGTQMEYDRQTHKLTIDVAGEIEIKAKGEIKILPFSG